LPISGAQVLPGVPARRSGGRAGGGVNQKTFENLQMPPLTAGFPGQLCCIRTYVVFLLADNNNIVCEGIACLL